LTEESTAQGCLTCANISSDGNKSISFINSAEKTFKGLFVIGAQIEEPWVWCQVEWIFFERKERIVHDPALGYCSNDRFHNPVIINGNYTFINLPGFSVKRNLGIRFTTPVDKKFFEQKTSF
jgi:hypothetical protein